MLHHPSEQLTLFDEPTPEFARNDWQIRETTVETARRWVKEWHYSAHMPGPGTRAWSVTAPASLDQIGQTRATIAVIMLSLPNNASGVAGRIGIDVNVWPGNVEISRVIAHPAAPKNTVSRSVAMALRVWRELGHTWVFSYADVGQNHHGGIYQALNAIYVGIGNPGGRPGYMLNGEPIHARSVVSRWGTQAWPHVQEIAAREGLELLRVDGMETEKHTYILPCGGPARDRALRKLLAPRALKYPKRDDHHRGLSAAPVPAQRPAPTTRPVAEPDHDHGGPNGQLELAF